MTTDDSVVIANGQGFWGDSPAGPLGVLHDPRIQYLTLDYLAEVTMSILQKARGRQPAGGFPADFPRLLESILPECVERGVKIVANAGGVNLPSCVEAVEAVARGLGLHIRVGSVSGDDVLGRLPELIANGEVFTNLDTGEPLAAHAEDVLAANVYLGAEPIARALQSGADIVVTGRCTDAALTLGPLIAEFGWEPDDYDRLASGTIAGHIIECGTQATGGNFTGWRGLSTLNGVGFPLVVVERDGSFTVTKPAGTGGTVNRHTVTAQLLYEIGDPKRYLTPDVCADFTTVELTETGPDQVRVTGVRGTPPPAQFKVSVGLRGGWMATAQLTVPGPDSVACAQACAEQIFGRLQDAGVVFAPDDVRVDFLGAGALQPGGSPATYDPPEVVLRIAVRDLNRRKVERFGFELAGAITGGPPGLTGFSSGRPRASEVVSFWPALVARESVTAQVEVREVGAA